jgi:hypothetical protein
MHRDKVLLYIANPRAIILFSMLISLLWICELYKSLVCVYHISESKGWRRLYEFAMNDQSLSRFIVKRINDKVRHIYKLKKVYTMVLNGK